MSELQDIAQMISEDESGANGDLTYQQQVKNAADSLDAWVYEALAVRDIQHLEPYQMRTIQELVAIGMIAQHNYTETMWRSIFAEEAASARSQVGTK